ncbi:MAG: glycosyltransferase [Verrucomicrobia bacterium]|nr:glycosyltransferase [Verrucomicrobiota bacterium]
MARRLKILVSAYACSPVRGSEPGMGWGWITALSRRHDLWVITEKERFETDIEAGLDRQPELRDRIRFFYLANRRHRILRTFWPPSYYWFLRRWHKKAYRLAQQLHAEVGFDVVHQLNMVGFREPGYLWRLDAPFVWGPVGGMGLMPWRFLPSLGFVGAVHHAARNLFNMLHRRLLMRPKHAAQRAGGRLIAATSETARNISRFLGQEPHVVCEVGPPDHEVGLAHGRQTGEPLRLVWSGLHVSRKALPLLLRALARLPKDVAWQLDVLGEGPRGAAWKRLARRLGVDERCRWLGWLPRERAVEVMHSGHAFVITSLLDLTSTVLPEALALGVPVICLDHCGFSDVVTPECGIKVPVHSPEQVIAGLAASIVRLWQDEPLRRRLAQAAPRRVQALSWESKADAIDAIYTMTMCGERTASRAQAEELSAVGDTI